VVPFGSKKMQDLIFSSMALDDHPWTISPSFLRTHRDSADPIQSLVLQIVHFFPSNGAGDFFLAQIPIQEFIARCCLCSQLTARRCPSCLLPWCSATHQPRMSSRTCLTYWCAHRSSSLTKAALPFPGAYIQRSAQTVTDGTLHLYVKEKDPEAKLLHCDSKKQYMIKQRTNKPKYLIFKARWKSSEELDFFVHAVYTENRGITSVPAWFKWFSISLADLMVTNVVERYVLGQ
jgi:hypothetical protein